MKIDLNTCVKGQKLKSKHGLILTYVGKLPPENYYQHKVKYPDGSFGTRTDDGMVFKNKPLPEDHDIVEILPLETQPLTYARLIELLQRQIAIDSEVANQNVTVYVPDTDEFYPIERMEINEVDDVLDKNHVFLIA